MSKQSNVILILEDDPILREDMKKLLQEIKLEVLPCKDIYDAKEEWEQNKSRISLISLDTNMNSEGLNAEEKALSRDSIYSGWIWLIKYPLLDKDHPFPLKRVFLLSEYILKLEKVSKGNKEYEYNKLKKLKDMNHLIEKGYKSNAINILIDAIKKELGYDKNK
jgi:CheY-like chemotaxis protein